MSREDAQVVREAFEAITGMWPNPSDEARAQITDHWFDPDIVYEEDPSWPGAGSYQGREAVVGAFDAYAEVLTATGATVEDVVDAGDRSVALVRIKGESEGGLPFENLWGYVCTVRDGRLLSFRAYFDEREALEAAGVSR